MTILTASKARTNLYRLLDQAAVSHEPIEITGKRNHAVLISKEDWNAIQETLYLMGVPGMRASIVKLMKTPSSKFYKKLSW